MKPSSRPSIAPLSRPPRSSARSQIPTPAQSIWQRLLFVGAALGLSLSLSAWLGRHEANAPGMKLPWQSFFLSAIFSTALAALLFASVGTLVWAFCSSSRGLRAKAPVVTAFFCALLSLVYVGARGIGEAFRLSSGSPLSLGAIEFLVEGARHLVLPLVVEYVGLAALLVVLSSAAALLVFKSVRACEMNRAKVGALLARSCASFLVLAALLHVLTTPKMAQSGGLRRTADISLLASIASRQAELAQMEEAAEQGKTPVPSGAPLRAGTLWATGASRMDGPRPHVVLIMLESVGIQHLGFEGYERKVTPHLDRIAKNSVRFRRARTTATHSNYAQMAVLSSLFPRRYSGLDTYRRLDYPRVLWHDFLSELGYQTATHSSQDETWQGMIRFQETGTETEFHHSGTYEGKHLRMGSEKIVPDEVTATQAIHWMEDQEGPFGLYLNFQSTHFPYRVPRGADRPYQPDVPTRGQYHYLHYPPEERPTVINRYDNALGYVDAQVGRIYDYLSRSGLLENTVLIVTSDHGEMFGEHGKVTHGRTLYDAEARVPLLVHYPKRFAPVDRQESVSTLDILPTLATALEVPSHPAFQGQSLLDEAAVSPRPSFINIQGMKSQDGVVCGDLKFINDRSAGELSLFDLSLDPTEKKNLVTDYPEVARALHQLVSAQMRAQVSYHTKRGLPTRSAFYAPRFAPCPLEVLPKRGLQAQLSSASAP